MYSPKRQRGNLAEDLVVQYLENNKYKIIERNYLRKWGEIDIITSKKEIVHFIEVKSVFINFTFVSHETNNFKYNIYDWNISVSRETHEFIDKINMLTNSEPVSCETGSEFVKTFNPVWNMTNKKRKSLAKTIKIYISEHFRQEVPDFQIDLIAVSLDYLRKKAYIMIIDNIIL